MDLEQQVYDLVATRFPDQLLGEGAHAGQRWIHVRRDRIVEVLKTLRDQVPFEMLMFGGISESANGFSQTDSSHTPGSFRVPRQIDHGPPIAGDTRSCSRKLTRCSD